MRGGRGQGTSGNGDSGWSNPTLSCTPGTALNAKVQTALTTGNALTGATADDFLEATLATVEAQRTKFDPLLARLYNLNPDGTAKADGSSLTAVSWDPRHDCALLAGSFGENVELITTNQTATGAPAPAKAIAVAGETEGKARTWCWGPTPSARTPPETTAVS